MFLYKNVIEFVLKIIIVAETFVAKCFFYIWQKQLYFISICPYDIPGISLTEPVRCPWDFTKRGHLYILRISPRYHGVLQGSSQDILHVLSRCTWDVLRITLCCVGYN